MSESDGHFPKLVKDIEECPDTWLPALLATVIRQCIEKGVFKDISSYCERVIVGFEGRKVLPPAKESKLPVLDVVKAVAGLNEPKDDQSCTQCGHIRPLTSYGVCHLCVNKEKS